MAFMRKSIADSGITGGIVAYLAFNQYKSHPVLENQKVKVPSLDTIKREYTDLMHPLTVAALPKPDANADALQQQAFKATSYFIGYLQGPLQNNPSLHVPVFHFNKELRVVIPFPSNLTGREDGSDTHEVTRYKPTREGYVFAGSLRDLQHSELRKDILEKNYLRCNNVLHGRNEYDPMRDAVILGTRDQQRCDELGMAILKDAAQVAAGLASEPIDEQHSISDTPVFSSQGKAFHAEGDLSEMSETAKNSVRLGHFVACKYFGPVKTRLSTSSFKTVGAILTGTNDSAKCLLLSLRKGSEIVKTSDETFN
jgi:hypothetical protein